MLSQKTSLLYFPQTVTNRHHLQYIYCKVLKKSDLGFSKNTRLLWLDLQQLTLNYTNFTQSSLQQFKQGSKEKAKDSIQANHLRFGEVTKINSQMRVEEFINKKTNKEWVLIFGNIDERNQMFAILKLIKKYQYESKLREPNNQKFDRNAMLYDIEEMLQVRRQSQPQEQTQNKQDPQFILSPEKNSNKKLSQFPQKFLKKNSQSQQFIIDKQSSGRNIYHPQEESIIDKIDSENAQSPRNDRELINNGSGNNKIMNSKYNRNGLIDNVVDSVEYQEDPDEDNHSPKLQQIGLGDISRIPVKREQNVESIDSFQGDIFNRQNTNYADNIYLNNIEQSKREYAPTTPYHDRSAYIDWNRLYHTEHSPSIYLNFIQECQKGIQNHLTAILHTKIILGGKYTRKGIQYTPNNLYKEEYKGVALATALSSYDYDKYEEMYRGISDEIAMKDAEFRLNFMRNRYLMENINKMSQQRSKYIVRPKLCCQLNYGAISIRCEAFLSEENYQKVQNWATDRGIRSAIETIQSHLKQRISEPVLFHHTQEYSLIIIQTPFYSLPSPHANALNTLTKTIQQTQEQELNIILSQLCYPKTLNTFISITSDISQLHERTNRFRNIEYWGKCLQSAYIARNMCILLRYEIFKEIINFINGNYQRRDKRPNNEHSIQGVTALIEMTQYMIEDWLNTLLSANGRLTDSLWKLLPNLRSATQHTQKSQTIPGIVLGCIIDNLSLKMWRYIAKDASRSLPKKITNGKLTIWRKPVIDFPIELTYSYNRANVLDTLKTSKQNQSGIFSADIKIEKYKDAMMNRDLQELFDIVLWQVCRMGYLQPWEYEFQTDFDYLTLVSTYHKIKPQKNKQKIFHILDTCFPPSVPISNSNLHDSHFQQQSNPQLIQIAPYLKLYLSTLHTPLSKTLKIYDFQELPLLQFILYKQNKNLHEQELDEFYKMLSKSQLEELQENEGQYSRSELYDCREIKPYFQRLIISRYIAIIKKFLKRNNGYAGYLLNGILEECAFWLGEFSILLQPVYMLFHQHYYLKVLSQNDQETEASAIQRYVQLTLKHYKSVIFLNIKIFGKLSLKVGQMHIYLAKAMIRMINMGYKMPTVSNHMRTVSKYDAPIIEILSALQCFDKQGHLAGYLEATILLGNINVMEKKYQRSGKQSVKPLLQPLNHIISTSRCLSPEQLSLYLSLIELVWRIYILIDCEHRKQEIVSPKNVKFQKISATTPQKEQLINKFLINADFSLVLSDKEKQKKLQNSLTRIIRLILGFMKSTDVINIQTQSQRATNVLKLHRKDKLINIPQRIQAVKQYLQKNDFNNMTRGMALNTLQKKLSNKNNFTGHISQNKHRGSEIRSEQTMLGDVGNGYHLYRNIIIAFDDIAYKQKQESKIIKRQKVTDKSEGEQEEKRNVEKSEMLIKSLVAFIGKQEIQAILD